MSEKEKDERHSKGWNRGHCLCAKVVSNSATPWTVTHQAPLSMGFPRQEIGVGSHALFQGDLPDPGIKPTSLMSPALTGRFFTTCSTWEAWRNLKLTLPNKGLSFQGLEWGSEFISVPQTCRCAKVSPWYLPSFELTRATVSLILTLLFFK